MRSPSALALIVVAFPFLISAARPASQPSAAGEKRLTVAHLVALRNGGEVRLAPGTYVSATELNIRNASGFALVGEGVTIRAQVRLDDCKDFRISGITFDGARAARGPSPNLPTLRLGRCSGFTLENCVFKDARGEHLFIESECRDGLVTNCRFLDAWRNAIAIVNGHDLRFTSITVDTVHGEVLGAGIDIESNLEDPEGANHDITVSDSTFRDCAESGVRVTDGRKPHRVNVVNCLFENVPSGVMVGGRDCRVLGNIFRNAKRPGGKIGEAVRAQVYVNGDRGGLTEISGNRFENLSGMGGVRVHPTWQGPVLITNNVFTDLKGKGVNAVSVYSEGAVVSGNVVLDVEDGIGIGVSGRGATVANNVLRGGKGGAGAIWSDVDGGSYAGNHVSGWQTAQSVPKGNDVK